MEKKELTLLYFSPTNTTRTVLEAIAKGIGGNISTVIDITRPENRSKPITNLATGPVLMGAPVYGGRLPKDAADCFKRIRSNGNPVILTVLYGNREYEDALLELKDIAVECGFLPVAAAAFIGEHSFSSKKYPIAQNRPDSGDLETAFLFGKRIADLLENNEKLENIAPVQTPGNFPYQDGMAIGAFPFIDVTNDCDECGSCISACPKEAIDETDNYSTINEKCIFCCACNKACPQEARVLKESPILETTKWLYKNCSKRKNPELFWRNKLLIQPLNT